MQQNKRNILLLFLSIAAGCVDGISFVSAGFFPANMTGNCVVLALAILHLGSISILYTALALLGYCLGAAFGSHLIHSPNADHKWSPRISITIFIAGIILLSSASVVWISGMHYLPILVIASAFAMGMQSAAVLRLGVSGVATIVVTGTLTTAITRIVEDVHRGVNDKSPSKEGPWLPSLSWLAYFLGAFLGGVQNRFHMNAIIALPGFLLVGIALIAGFSKRESKSET
ncbi:MAG: YoaK family protein [Chthoniobacterales bacterium]